MEHLANELDSGWLVWILLFEVHNKSKGAVFKWCVCWSDDDGIPVAHLSAPSRKRPGREHLPSHDIVGDGRGGDSSGRICLHSLEAVSMYIEDSTVQPAV